MHFSRFYLYSLLALIQFSSDAEAVKLNHRAQGSYYLIRVLPEANYPVDCQISWQVRMGSFTRQGQSYLTDVDGVMWSEAMGPMTQDVDALSYGANCQMSAQEKQRRAVETERENALQRQRQRDEQERQLTLERQRQAQQQAADLARQTAAKKQADEASRRAQTIQVPNYSDVIQKNEAARREQLLQRQHADDVARRKAIEQQKAQQAVAKQQERQRQSERIQKGQAISQQADGISQQLRQQAGAQDAALSEIAGGGANREQGMNREANQAVQSQSDADIRRFLQQRLDTGQ